MNELWNFEYLIYYVRLLHARIHSRHILLQNKKHLRSKFALNSIDHLEHVRTYVQTIWEPSSVGVSPYGLC